MDDSSMRIAVKLQEMQLHNCSTKASMATGTVECKCPRCKMYRESQSGTEENAASRFSFAEQRRHTGNHRQKSSYCHSTEQRGTLSMTA